MTVWYQTHITQGFKWQPGGLTKGHSGIDLAEPNGTPLTAAVSGQIAHAGPHPWGGQVDIRFSVNGQPFVLTYLHLSDIYVKAGQTVTVGQEIGLSGGATWSSPYPTQRRFSTGPHLHFELTHGSRAPYNEYNPWRPSPDNYPIDPTAFFYALKDNGIQAGGLPNIAAGTKYGTGYFSTADPFRGQATHSVTPHTTTTDHPSPTTPVAMPGGSQSTGQWAHEALQELPGFDGLVTAVDRAEAIIPYNPPESINPMDSVNYTFKWLTSNTMSLLFRDTLIFLGIALLIALFFALVRDPIKEQSQAVAQVAPLLLM